MHEKTIARLTLICLLALTADLCAKAQMSTAAMFGTVTDASGVAIPDATLTVTQNDTLATRVLTTGGDGSYRADFLPVGPYNVKVSATSFGRRNAPALH